MVEADRGKNSRGVTRRGFGTGVLIGAGIGLMVAGFSDLIPDKKKDSESVRLIEQIAMVKDPAVKEAIESHLAHNEQRNTKKSGVVFLAGTITIGIGAAINARAYGARE